MSEICQHTWAESWFTVSARIQRAGKPTFVVANARLQRCVRCESFLLSEQTIARQLFRADGHIHDLLIRMRRGDAS